MNNLNKSKPTFDGRQFVTIPKIIHENDNLNASQKIILGYIHSFKNEWNHVKTKTIAEAVGLSVRAVQNNVSILIDMQLIEAFYYAGRNRRFKSNIEDTTDAKIIIPGDILSRTDLDSTYKITMGLIVASSLGNKNFLGGYNFNTVERLAEELGLSVSSVYRHIQVLISEATITRDLDSKWLLIPQDSYSRAFSKQQARLQKDYLKQKDKILITPKEDALLDRIWNRL